MPPRLKATQALTSRAQFEATVDEICKLQLRREQRVNLRDRLLQEVQETHNPEIEGLGQDISAKLVLCENFAAIHRDSLFVGKMKSAAASLGIYGFRIGNPTLKLLNRKWKWDTVLEAIRAKEWNHLIRIKQEANKDALKNLEESDLAAIGCRIEQDETFFIEPNRENPERIQAN